MRSPIVLTAATVLFASPLWAAPPQHVLGPRTVAPALVLCTDQPVTTTPTPALTVAAGHNPDGRRSLVEGDVVVINVAPPQALAVGQQFVARRLQGGVHAFPRAWNGFAAVRTAGWLTVTAVDGPVALARIDFSCDPIEPGDYLEAYVERALPDTADGLGSPQFADRAQVLFGADHRENLGDGDVFSLDRGATQGVAAGARFAIYRDRKDGTPLVHVADAVVVEPSENTSKAVLVMVKDAVAAGDVAVRRQAP